MRVSTTLTPLPRGLSIKSWVLVKSAYKMPFIKSQASTCVSHQIPSTMSALDRLFSYVERTRADPLRRNSKPISSKVILGEVQNWPTCHCTNFSTKSSE